MECRPNCGACCIAASINKPYFGMPNGKPAGEFCIHLDAKQWSCGIWGTEHYPSACKNFAPEASVCGTNRAEALSLITILEKETLS
jgi:hypothetical protein